MTFCYFCGTGPTENYIIPGTKVREFHCSICQAQFRIEVIKETQITLEEAEANFNKIPLTDSQKGSKRRLIPTKK